MILVCTNKEEEFFKVMPSINIWVYIIGAVIILFALKFRKAMKQSATFVASSAHAFASEYNDAYTTNDDTDIDNQSGTDGKQSNESKED
jgi:uncharacterized protein YpmB